MASSHIARITAGGVSDRRIAHSLYGYCTTAANTAAKVVNLYTGSSTTADGTWSANDLFDGLSIKVRFQYSNTASSPTLNVNGTGAKAIYRYGTTKPGNTTSDSWKEQEIVTLTYDTLLNSSGCWVIEKGGSNSLRNILDGDSTGSIRQISALQPNSTYSMGTNAFAQGNNTQASGTSSHAEGSNTKASQGDSHAEGYYTIASAQSAHAEGTSTQASGHSSHAEGSSTKASAQSAHAEGNLTTASGSFSHAEGDHTTASGDSQHVEGKYNIASTVYAHIVGNGDSSNNSNAYTLDWDGNGVFAGKVTAGSTATNPMDLVTLSQLQTVLPSPLSSYHNTIGDGTTTSFTINHYLNTKFIIVSVNITDNGVTYIAPNGIAGTGQVGYGITINSVDSITIDFTSAPGTNAAEISIISAIAYSSATDQNYLRIS